MAWLTTSDVAAHIEHDLSATAIQRLIDDAEEDILARFGAHTSQTDYLTGGDLYLYTRRPVSSVSSITETVAETDTTLSSDDYSIVVPGGSRLKRLRDGTNPATRWAREVTVTYTPVDDLDRRNRVGLDLIRLALQYSALRRVRDGDHSESGVEYQKERNQILSGLKIRRRSYA